MIAHSPTAWDHVHFKDVLVKVSNVEVYYKAISFYLVEHPDLLVDMLKVRSARSPSVGMPCPGAHRSGPSQLGLHIPACNLTKRTRGDRLLVAACLGSVLLVPACSSLLVLICDLSRPLAGAGEPS